MSAPDTNVKKQTRRHKAPLTGIPLAIALATLAFLGFLAWAAFTDADTSGSQTDEAGEAATVAPTDN